MSNNVKAVMSLSGGMDSTTVLAWLLSQGADVTCLNFIYGSKHNQYEEIAAQAVAAHYGVKYIKFDLTEAFSPMKSNLLKSGDDIPEGHYSHESMSLTVVPGRNSIFASIMCGVAESIGAKVIALGIHQGDHDIYPDCRKEYFYAMKSALYLASDKKVEMIAPFLDTNKIGILDFGFRMQVPYELTRTCYKDQIVSCGKCGSCNERIEAFATHGVKDPIDYAENINWGAKFTKFKIESNDPDLEEKKEE
jgi:7-cyano-7-deazaguanine synthase